MKFSERFQYELLESESVRVRMLVIVLSTILITSSISWWFFPQLVLEVLHEPKSINYLLWLTTFMLIFQIGIWLEIHFYRKKQREIVPEYVRFFGTAVEMAFPTAILGLISYFEQNYHLLSAPPFLFYFFFITLSALRLNFWISAFAGLMSSCQYVILSYWMIDHMAAATDEESIFMNNMFYFEKGVMLFICGLLAGFVGRELSKRIKRSFKVEEERNKVQMLFGQQVSPQVMQALLSEQAVKTSQNLEVTVMFMDIRDFTPFAESRTPEEIIAFQNAIFSPIIEIIHQNGGIINQILGDGFMATFGAPITSENHAEEAINASLSIIDTVQKLVKQQRIPETKIGLGLHSGDVVVGNIGNHIRRQYSITGTTVITAARIEQLNKVLGTQVLLSKSTFLKAQKSAPRFTCIGEKQLKGQEKQVEVYCLSKAVDLKQV